MLTKPEWGLLHDVENFADDSFAALIICSYLAVPRLRVSPDDLQVVVLGRLLGQEHVGLGYGTARSGCLTP